MKSKTNLFLIIGLIMIIILGVQSQSFTLFEDMKCGIVGLLKDDGSGTKMCLPNGKWSGILDCTQGKCGIRDTWGIEGYCQWLDLKCVGKSIYMCGRNGVFTSIGKIDGYCSYSISSEVNPNPPQNARCTPNSDETLCVGQDFYQCRFSAFTFVGNIAGKCGYVGESRMNTDYSSDLSSSNTNILNQEVFKLGSFSVTWLYIIIGGLLVIILIKK